MYNCKGCKKEDPDFTGQVEDCDECLGSGLDVDNADKDCFVCDGRGNYVRRLHSIKEHMWARNDAYGIYTGLFCDKCYEDPSKYTYKKYRYHDEGYCGERLENDY